MFTSEPGTRTAVLPPLAPAGSIEPQPGYILLQLALEAISFADNAAAGVLAPPKFTLGASHFQNNTLAGDGTPLLLTVSGAIVSDIKLLLHTVAGHFRLGHGDRSVERSRYLAAPTRGHHSRKLGTFLILAAGRFHHLGGSDTSSNVGIGRLGGFNHASGGLRA
ncbi:hypothetical protein H3H36_13310 [Duganella sp. FT3S]|uniref:Uncharacterized protein n=1 Tax=Rugamonas fusca TaxID=2758568 RepID=A0A7W2EI91_9BURK|nr:hypothetical protein [Rugamonas fusca]MBA5606329.1 hypothetical protein [Rugamonas fusca]